jgi:hypothetical protein
MNSYSKILAAVLGSTLALCALLYIMDITTSAPSSPVHTKITEIAARQHAWVKIIGNPVHVFSADITTTNVSFFENSIDLMQIEVQLTEAETATAFVNLRCLSIAQGGRNSFGTWKKGDEVMIASVPSKCGDGRGGEFKTPTYFITDYRKQNSSQAAK